jgi:hypothetical protein
MLDFGFWGRIQYENLLDSKRYENLINQRYENLLDANPKRYENLTFGSKRYGGKSSAHGFLTSPRTNLRGDGLHGPPLKCRRAFPLAAGRRPNDQMTMVAKQPVVVVVIADCRPHSRE